MTRYLVPVVLAMASCGSSAPDGPPPPPPGPPPGQSVEAQMTPVTAAQLADYAAIFEEACIGTLPAFIGATRVLEGYGFKGIDAETAFDGTALVTVKPGDDCFLDVKWKDRAALVALVEPMANRADYAFKRVKGEPAWSGATRAGEQLLLLGSRAESSPISSFGLTVLGR